MKELARTAVSADPKIGHGQQQLQVGTTAWDMHSFGDDGDEDVDDRDSSTKARLMIEDAMRADACTFSCRVENQGYVRVSLNVRACTFV